ncbi:MAG TPA: alpha/beta family hydrolase [Terriglobales bacterium]|nr:alpha/beta family hydrolase [Terriglobales bacterium]
MPESLSSFFDASSDPPVRGFLHRVEQAREGLVLTHGAGANCQSALLTAVAESFASAGLTVLRCDLPFRQLRPFGPPRPADAARDREGLRHALSTVLKLASGRVFLGGHSYGGRQAAMLCAENPGLADGLLLLSYPLHPPRKPGQLRIQHLPRLQTSSLFVHGTRDPFGSIAELESALKLIPGRTRLLPVEGAGHDLGFKGKARREELPAAVVRELETFFRAV